jgi:TonB family protein
MTASLLLDNVLAWSAQVAILTAVAALAAFLFERQHPRPRLFFWQAILFAILILPFVQPWTQSVDVSNNGVSISMQPVAIVGSAAREAFTWHREYLLFIFAAGTILRLLWIAAGFIRLRRHRLASSTLAEPPVPFERQHVRWYISDTVSGPVTFGWMRPSILLPSRVNHLPDDLREAIATHELVHVERADWLFVLTEELIRAILWFHPAIWFVLSRIQLAREQTVDREVIDLTQNRDRYLDALVAVAQQRLRADVAPAPLFLKKRQLAARVADVLKETRMSKPRLIASFATVLPAAFIAARIAVWFFPLEAPAQTPVSKMASPLDQPGITVDAGAPLMHRTPVMRGFSTASGSVVIDASVNAKGEVTDARVVSGPEELRKYAIQSVLQWHYSTVAALPPTVRVTIKYDPAPAPSSVRVVPTPAPTAAGAVIKQIQILGATPEITVHEGDAATQDAFKSISETAREVDEHFMPSFSPLMSDGHSDFIVRLVLPGGSIAPAPVRGVLGGVSGGVASGIPEGAPAPQRIRVGGNVQQNNLVNKVVPVYPPLAKQAKIQGVVELAATINKDGTIQNLELLSGHPLLVPAAVEAVKQWVYKPTLLNGNPVEVVTQIDVNFTLVQ